MLLSRLVSRSISSFVILFVALSLIGDPISTRAQLPPKHILLRVRHFADIQVTVLGPSIVKIDWMPLAGANKYFVQRNGARSVPPSNTILRQPYP